MAAHDMPEPPQLLRLALGAGVVWEECANGNIRISVSPRLGVYIEREDQAEVVRFIASVMDKRRAAAEQREASKNRAQARDLFGGGGK